MLRDRWRLIPFQYHNAAVNMAIDEAVAEAISFNEASPTVRIYGWRPSAISIGRFQSAEDEVELEECRRRGIDLVRRRTGGGAVYHDEEGEITYSVICPERLVSKDINASYRDICRLIITGLAAIGIEAEFKPINDVLVGGRKISGSAQTRRQGVFTMHGTVLFDVDPETMFSVLKVGRTKISDKDLTSFQDRVTSVRDVSEATLEELLLAMFNAFVEGKEWFLDDLGRDESARVEVIARDRYSNDEWNLSR
jgi:lipoate-protein ligase A